MPNPAEPPPPKTSAGLTAALLLLNAAAVLRDAFLADRFGAGGTMDAYVVAKIVPDAIGLVFATAATAAFVPAYSRLLERGEEEEAGRLFSGVAIALLLVVGLLTASVFAFGGPLCQALNPRSPLETETLLRTLTLGCLPLCLGTLLAGALYARRVWIAPGLARGLNDLGVVGALSIPGVSILAAAWGNTIGISIGALVIPLLAIAGVGLRFRPRLNVRDRAWVDFCAQWPAALMTSGTLGIALIVMQIGATRFPVGSNATLAYAVRFIQWPIAAFGTALALGVYPALVTFAGTDRPDAFRRQIGLSIRTCLYWTIPATLGLWVLAPDFVRLILGQGAFHASDCHRTAGIVRGLALAIPGASLFAILCQAHVAARQSRLALGFSFLALIGLAVSVGLARGLTGVALAPASIVLVLDILLMASLRVEARPILTSLGKTLVAASGMSLLLAPTVLPIPSSKTLAAIAILVGLLSWFVYRSITRQLGMQEVSVIDRAAERTHSKDQWLG